MPPWKPDPGFGPPLQGARYLSESEIELINEWARLGSPSGDLEKAPTPPLLVNEWKLGEPDLVIDLSEAYMLPAEGLDVYRNFVIPLPIEDTIYVRAFELLPETRLAIHHALLMFDPTNRSRLQDESESGPGYDGMGIGSSKPPSGHIVGWTPGQVPYQAYPGTAWELNPGTDLVLQLHMLPSGKAEQINPKIGLYLSKEPPSKPSFVFQMRSYELDIPAGESDYLVEQSLKVTAPIRIISVYPHAHYIGKDMQLFATLPDGSKQWLLRISDWDFNWQGDYRYEEPLFLPEGSVIHMAYHFDNSAENIRNPFDPPKKIQGGWRSEDEMAEAMIQVLPVDPADLSKLQDAQKEYDFKLAGGEARFHYFSGIYLEQQNEFERAITSFKSALTLDPTFASAYFQIGAILEKLGNPAQAEDLYEEALAYQPDLISARLAVAKLMMQKNQIRQAGFILEDVYANNPEHLLACIYLARYYMARGEIDSALKTFQEGDKYFKDAPQFHLEYGQTLLSKDRQKAEQRLIQATDAIPDKPDLGSIKPLKKIHSEAFYQLALLYEEDAKWPDVENALDQCLQNDPDHLDALLKSAATAIRSNDTTKAFNRLLTLVDKPEKETFSREDIVANLPLPVGAKLLAEAYQKSGQKQNAVDSLTFSIKKLQDEGKSESTISLEALRDNYLEDIGN
ncbi:MAG: tetratricopeptide repeat protein [Verrucomicrobia bacterium]|nr:tetratricopeptide repeat protein [Verrucomicrobiota bacterium]